MVVLNWQWTRIRIATHILLRNLDKNGDWWKSCINTLANCNCHKSNTPTSNNRKLYYIFCILDVSRIPRYVSRIPRSISDDDKSASLIDCTRPMLKYWEVYRWKLIRKYFYVIVFQLMIFVLNLAIILCYRAR